VSVQEYISNGIIENYVLGICDEKESADFERMCAKHPEISEAREAFEVALEDYARVNAIQPPRHLKSRIFAHIEIELQKKNGIVHHEGGPSNIHPKINWLKYIAAAAVILLIVSTALNFLFFHRHNNYIKAHEQLLVTQKQLSEKEKTLEDKLKRYEAAFNVMKDPDMTQIELKPLPESPSSQSSATVYWSKRNKDVFLIVHHLPPVRSDQHYQLWAVAEGKYVDAGIFNIPLDETLIRLNKIEKAEGFAVTLPNGVFNKTAAMNQVYLAGYIKS
jgi:hypothetical protein